MKGVESSHSSDYQKSEKNNKMDHSQFFTIGNNGLQADQQQPKAIQSQFKKVQNDLDDDQSDSLDDQQL